MPSPVSEKPSSVTDIFWLAIIAAYLLAGIWGHDPWKQDETYSFGIIYHFFTTHSWVVPVNAGQPFMEKPPLYYWTAVLFMKLLGGVLPLHDAARTASVFYMLVAVAAQYAAAKVLYKGHNQQAMLATTSVVLLLGSIGLVRHAHDMFTDVALLAGMAVAMLGLVLWVMRPLRWLSAGAVLGLGIGMAFLSKGLIVPGIIGITILFLFVVLPDLRNAAALRILLAAFAVASPFLFLWPLALYRESPALFMEWFWQNNLGRFLGFSVGRLGAPNQPFYMLLSALWFAFPALPLTVLVQNKLQWRLQQRLLPTTLVAVGLVVLVASASARALYLLPLLPPLALLGAQACPILPIAFLVRWNALVKWLASALALMILTMWMCLNHPAWPQPFARFYGEWLPLGYIPDGQGVAMLFALTLLLGWGALCRKHSDTVSHTLMLWLMAVTMLWGVFTSLLNPWANKTRSYRYVLDELHQQLAKPEYAGDCVARDNLGESLAPMWQYFGRGRGNGPWEGFDGNHCRLLLRMQMKSAPLMEDSRWQVIWQGARRMDNKDLLVLYARRQ